MRGAASVVLLCSCMVLATATKGAAANSSGGGGSSSRGSAAGVVAEIAVPCYNEQLRLPTEEYVAFAQAQLAALASAAANPASDDAAAPLPPPTSHIKFLFVNDGSTDGTRELLDGLAARFPSTFRALHLDDNVGKAEAVRLGMLHSLATDGGAATAGGAGVDVGVDASTPLSSSAPPPPPTLVGFWDGDLATPLSEIPTFLGVFESRPHIEMVFGSRVALLGRNITRRPERHYLGRIFATGASLLLGLPVYDTQCGAKLFRATPDLAAALAAPFHSRWIFDVELLARFVRLREAAPAARRPAGVIYEQPLAAWRDVPGSKLRLGSKLRALAELFDILWGYFLPWSPAPAPAAGGGDRGRAGSGSGGGGGNPSSIGPPALAALGVAAASLFVGPAVVAVVVVHTVRRLCGPTSAPAPSAAEVAAAAAAAAAPWRTKQD